MLMPTRILVPTDFSKYSDKALEEAVDIAKQYHAKVFLLHVNPLNLAAFDAYVGRDTFEQINEGVQAQVKVGLRNQLEKFPEAKEVEVATDIRQGIVCEEILLEEKEKGIDLIVIGFPGRTGIINYLVHGVTRNVLKGCKCPVLLTNVTKMTKGQE